MGVEDEEVAKMGCPSLGEHTRLEVVIEESYEFKVTAHPKPPTHTPHTHTRTHTHTHTHTHERSSENNC